LCSSCCEETPAAAADEEEGGGGAGSSCLTDELSLFVVSDVLILEETGVLKL